MRRVVNFLRGSVEVEAAGPFPERFVNLCAQRGVPFWGVEWREDGAVRTRTNHAGGILGGITTGMPILFRLGVKPTSSISLEQDTVNITTHQNDKLVIHGRHDPIIVPRAVVVIESMAALTLADLLLRNTGARLDTLKKFYLPS